ncbi:hypothetical protein BACI349Y_450049 [Bacillus sp. 349Y]|nr:hypothetical protein BACI349Y_450049 [Bacillus sp. 349Y]
MKHYVFDALIGNHDILHQYGSALFLCMIHASLPFYCFLTQKTRPLNRDESDRVTTLVPVLTGPALYETFFLTVKTDKAYCIVSALFLGEDLQIMASTGSQQPGSLWDTLSPYCSRH